MEYLLIECEKNVMKKILCSVVFMIFSFSTLAFAQEREMLTLQTALDEVLEQAVEHQNIVGAVVLVSHKGQVVYQRAVGYADREARVAMQENNIFRLASMTKPLVSITALSLIDQGKLGLDDPVSQWLPYFQPKLDENAPPPEITVRQLLTHTAGLDYVFFEQANGPYHQLGVSDGLDQVSFDLEENLRRIAHAPLLYLPGTKWHYSLAVDVLGAIIVQANGSSLEEAVQTYVTRPLQMSDTSFVVTDPTRLAVPYADGDPTPVRMSDPHIMPVPMGSAVIYSPSRVFDHNAYQSGGAGMVSTAQDYMRFLEAFRTGEQSVLTPQTYSQFTQNATGDMLIDALGEGWSFGFGVAVLKDPELANVPMHEGTWSWSGVYGSVFFVDPQAELSIVILTNTAISGMTGEFPDEIINIIYQSDLFFTDSSE